MANPQRGEVALTVGDRAYTLVLDMDGICKAEAVLSSPGQIVSIAEIFYGAAINSQRHARVLIWASLQRHHKDVTLEKAGELMSELGGSEEFFKVVAKLRGTTEPDAEDRPSGRPLEARPVDGTGARMKSTPVASD